MQGYSDALHTSVAMKIKNLMLSSLWTLMSTSFVTVKSAVIQKIKIKEVLEKESWGRDILKVSVDTAMNQIKYER